MKALLHNLLIFLVVSLVLGSALRFWPYLVYHAPLQDVRTVNPVLPPSPDDTVFEELRALGSDLHDLKFSGTLDAALRSENAVGFLTDHFEQAQTALAWYRADGAQRLREDAPTRFARIPVLLVGVDPSNTPTALEVFRLHRLLLIYAGQAFQNGQTEEGLDAFRFSLALGDYLLQRPPLERLYLADVVLTEALHFMTEVLPREHLTEELVAAVPSRAELDGALIDAYWLRAVVIANFADDPYKMYKAINPNFNPWVFQIMGGYHRTHTMNMIDEDFLEFQADVAGGIDQVRYGRRLLNTRPSHFFSFNPIGKKFMSVGALVQPDAEEIVVRHGHVIALADMVRLHAALAAQGAAWDGALIEETAARLELRDPFTNAPYRVNQQGLVEVFAPEDPRRQWTVQPAWIMRGMQGPAAAQPKS
ncbi:hypothetical protein [Acanthopleuribacter pedis]|uniref:Uncharacterized protein n=1 Tax=Acanthopleuribacter pedis TaxID=442870 RepID=A0A8J7U2P1_9BACT|nr:hypothetical protein [Acanthopleuribacter pedis]MBO1317473.1 hypothetical protein [Acanthopleuribacter pedis]